MKSNRRTALKKLALLGSIGAWALAPASAQTKATKQAMQYQDQPKNGQECDTCMHFLPAAKPGAPGGCKVVEGEISPKGWCAAYVKKP
jgi:hypothetical protein